MWEAGESEGWGQSNKYKVVLARFMAMVLVERHKWAFTQIKTHRKSHVDDKLLAQKKYTSAHASDPISS